MKEKITSLVLVLVVAMSMTVGASAASYIPDDVTYQNLNGQQLAIAPHGAIVAGSQLFLGEDGLDVVVVIDDVQNAAAGAVGQVRNGLVFLAALDAAAANHIFHMCFSL